MGTKLGGVGIVLSFLLLAGCEDFDIGPMSDRYKQDFHYSYPLSAGGTVEVENANGAVEIVGWDKNTVEIDGTKYAGSEERLNETKIETQASAGSVRVRTVPPLDHRGNYGARYTIHVPKRVELRAIRSSNGAIRVSGIEGSLDAKTSNGAIEVTDVTGDTVVHTSNGGIRADVKKGNFEATTSNGPITARLLESDSRPVRLGSSNGRIDLTMDAAREVHADTSNSSITVRMPGSAGASVRAHTSNASIDSDFDVSVHGGTLTKHRLEGTIGAGGPLLDLGTSNGSIKILRL